ncbi:MAG: CinA family protein [Bacilli bacterium]|nr:CinA family protein [Bacilli bacterium]
MEAKKLISLLSKKKLTIGSVESLTAGLFIATLAEVPGASKVVRGGLITYQTGLKTSLLGIKKEVIKKYGVVSKEAATLMAKEGSKILKSDIVVSFTGNAGPTKEPGGAEVGRVHIAILCKPDEGNVKKFTKVYKGPRNAIRKAVVSDAISLIYQKIK